MRQAFAGMIWSQQFYHYRVARWLEGDPPSWRTIVGVAGLVGSGRP